MSFYRSTLDLHANQCLRSGHQYKSRGRARRANSWAILVLVCLAIFTPSINAQQKRGASEQDRPADQLPASVPVNTRLLDNSDRDYLISPGDVIRILVEDAPELSRDYQVYTSGDIEMPVLGLVNAKQKTSYALARLIAKGLREQEYLKTPNVVVTITKYYNHTFFIQGSVKSPGAYQIEGQPSLLTLLSLAGGLADNHGASIIILRPRKTQKRLSEDQSSGITDKPQAQTQIQTAVSNRTAQAQTNDPDVTKSTDYELINVNLNALYNKGQFEQNQRLEPGDIVNIPRADTFFVAGEVHAPGSFPLKEGTTLRQAISLAQGMTFKAKSAQGVIFREDSVLGTRQEIKIDISAVMSGKSDDILVKANDVIIVPNSRAKSIGGTLLTALGISSARLPIRY